MKRVEFKVTKPNEPRMKNKKMKLACYIDKQYKLFSLIVISPRNKTSKRAMRLYLLFKSALVTSTNRWWPNGDFPRYMRR